MIEYWLEKNADCGLQNADSGPGLKRRLRVK